jgi:hypothetical protein
MKDMLSLIVVTSVLLIAGIGNAKPINGGFETGDFTGWQTVGDSSVQTSSFGITPVQGTHQAVLTNDWISYHNGGAVTSDSYVYPLSGSPAALNFDDSFFGLPAGSLQAITKAPFPGERDGVGFWSAIKQTFHGVAGSRLNFDWNYLTSDGYNWDFSFVSLVSSDSLFLEKLAGNDPSTVVGGANYPAPLVASNTVFQRETGFKTFSYILGETGIYTLGIGVTGVGDETNDSGLSIDDIKVVSVPEPSAIFLLALGSLALIGVSFPARCVASQPSMSVGKASRWIYLKSTDGF